MKKAKWPFRAPHARTTSEEWKRGRFIATASGQNEPALINYGSDARDSCKCFSGQSPENGRRGRKKRPLKGLFVGLRRLSVDDPASAVLSSRRYGHRRNRHHRHRHNHHRRRYGHRRNHRRRHHHRSRRHHRYGGDAAPSGALR